MIFLKGEVSIDEENDAVISLWKFLILQTLKENVSKKLNYKKYSA